MSVILQKGIIAVPNQPPEILEQLKELQQHIKRLETDSRKLMDENENFKRQIDGLMTSKVVLYADMEDKMASQNDKIDTIQEKLNGEFTRKQNELKSKIDETAASVEEIKNTPKAVVAFRATCVKNFPRDSLRAYDENPVIWKNIDYNIGSAYDYSNGKFTCPYDGIYSFYATSTIFGQGIDILTQDPDSGPTQDSGPDLGRSGGIIAIYVNGSEKVNHFLLNHGSGNDEYKYISPQGVFKLQKGDTVHIHMNGLFAYAGSDCTKTYFQGHLIDLL